MHVAKIYAEKRISVIALDEEHIYHKTTYTTDLVTWPTACRECHLSRIPWHFFTGTMLVYSGPGEVAAAAEHREITKHAHLGQFVPVHN